MMNVSRFCSRADILTVEMDTVTSALVLLCKMRLSRRETAASKLDSQHDHN